MKILDKYLLRAYITSFLSVFVILMLIFILQTVWLFISELAGKDLNLVLILKFLLYKMPSLVPLVLPLSVLLSSIMTFGAMAENYEFAAMKSAGISFKRIITKITYFILLLSLAAFFFANNIIPYADFKFTNFRINIAKRQPALAITEGQFSAIGDFNIKVDKKYGENEELLEGVTIHKKENKMEETQTIIKSKKGKLISSEDSNMLQLLLFDGYYYEDIVPENYQEREKKPFIKAFFKEYNMNIDLSKLENNQDMLQTSNSSNIVGILSLKYAVDSLQKNYKNEVISVADNVYYRFGLQNNFATDSLDYAKLKTPNLTSILPTNEKAKILEIALSDVLSSKQNIEINDQTLLFKKKEISTYWLSIHEKFVITFACVLMFFIGAPLGAIIRKGGLGLPIVFAMIIFITYHFLNTFGKKVAEELSITPFLGSWISFFLLTPLAVFLSKSALNDRGDISFEGIYAPFILLFKKFKKQ